MALDIAQVNAAEVLYIEDRAMFVQVAESLGIKGIQHSDFSITKGKLADYGFII